MMQIVIILLGVVLVFAGLYFAIGGFGQGKSGGGFRDIKMEGPPWLILVAIGVGLVVFGAVGDWSSNPEIQTAGDVSQRLVSMANVPTYKINGLTWTTTSKTDVDWAQASAYCKGLNVGGLKYRLPTIAELRSITDSKHPDTFGHKINRIFQDGIGTNVIWSSESDGPGAAFTFDFDTLKRGSSAQNFAGGFGALCVGE